MRKFYISSLFSLLWVINLQAQQQYTFLQTGAVQESWYTEPCSIDTMVIDVLPKGLYAEVSITMDFSTRGLNFNNSDSLELQMMFQLPPDVEITDMWLWVFGQPEMAGVYDRWTASQIYENIVQRRTDPAILYHYTWYDYYSNNTVTNLFKFNIFPMLNDMPRKTKITYQIPLRPNGNGSFRIPLPLNIAQLTSLPLEAMKLRYHPGEEFDDASLIELPDQEFIENNGVLETDLTQFEGDALTMRFSTQRPSTYLGLFEDPEVISDYYQFSMIPNDFFDLEEENRRVAVLFDHMDEQSNGDFSTTEVVNGFLGSFLPRLAEDDSVNVLFSDVINQWMSTDWMTADPTTLSWITDNLNSTDISEFSDLSNLLLDAYQFITENGGVGDIVLISNSNQYDELNSSNTFIENMADLFIDAGIKIHVVDVDNYNTYSERFYTNNQVFHGNEYLFNNLTSITGGEYWSIQNTAYSDMLDFCASGLSPTLDAVDIHISRSNGFTHSSYSVGSGAINAHVDQSISLSGISVGDGVFQVSCSAIESNGTIHQEQVNISENATYELDTVTDNIWGGLRQRQMYGVEQNNSIVQSVIQNSKDHRVLSKYTAFLALEPSEGPLPIANDDPFVDPITVNVEDVDETLNTFAVFPNPFNDILTLDVNMAMSSPVMIRLYDVSGKELMMVFTGEFKAGKSMRSFDLSPFGSGIYIIRITDDSEKLLSVLKAVKQ